MSKFHQYFNVVFLSILLSALPSTSIFAAQSTPQKVSNVQKGYQLLNQKTGVLVLNKNNNEVRSITANTGNLERYVIELEAVKNYYAKKEKSLSRYFSATRVNQRKAQQLQLTTLLFKSKLIEKEIRSLNRLSNVLVVETTSQNTKEISKLKGVKSIRKEQKYQISLHDSVPLINANETWLRMC